MNKSIELHFIDEFIDTYNKIYAPQQLVRDSDSTQEKPDAICLLNQTQLIGIETTFVMRLADTPHISLEQIEKALATDTKQATDYVRERITVKNHKLEQLYKPENPHIHQFWLLMIGASVISIDELEHNLTQHPIEIRFDRTFIHKGICCDADLVELVTKQ